MIYLKSFIKFDDLYDKKTTIINMIQKTNV